MSARHDESNLAACFGCGAQPGTDHDGGCKYGLQAEVAALRTSLEETRDELRTLRPALEMSESELEEARQELATEKEAHRLTADEYKRQIARAEEARQEREQIEALALTNARAADRHFARIGELEAALRQHHAGHRASRCASCDLSTDAALQPTPTQEEAP